jgi:hypothetical protein
MPRDPVGGNASMRCEAMPMASCPFVREATSSLVGDRECEGCAFTS